MNKEFKAKQFKDSTVYTLESASSGGTSSGSVASVSSPMGGVRKRGDNLIAQEANKNTVPATTPRNFVAKNAKTSGAGAHKDKKKAEKQGDVKHKKPFMEALRDQIDELKSKLPEAYSYGRNRGYNHGFADPNAPRLGGRSAYGQGAADDESNMLYIYQDGRLKQKMVSNRNEQQARAQGFRDSHDEALKVAGIIRSKFDPKKFVQNQGGKWVQVFPYGEDQGVAEAGMPSSVIKNKQRNAEMSDKDFHAAHKDKSEDDLKAMAWRHGYGKGSTHYVDKHKKGQQGVAEGSEDLVQIEYWQQETMESGRWVKTKPIPRATAEKIVNSFERGEIVDVEQGVAEGFDKLSPQQKAHEYNLDAAQKELDRRHEQGEDMTGAKINKKTYKIVKPKQQGVAEGAPELLKKEMPLHRHAEKLLAQNGVSKDDPDYHHHLGNTIKHLRQFGNIDLINKSDEQGVAEEGYGNDPSQRVDPRTGKKYVPPKSPLGQGVAEGEVVPLGKKHRGDLSDTHSCPKCGGDLQGGKYMGHAVKVCQPCKQVYLPPNSGIDQQGNKTNEQGVAEGWGMNGYATAQAQPIEPGKGRDIELPENPDWYNDEANSMTTSQLKSLYKHANKLRQAVQQMQQQGDTLEPWQQSKVTKAADYLDAVFNAVDDDHDMGESNHPDEKEDKALIRKMVKARALKQEDGYMAELQAKLDEKIPKNAPVDVWIKDFEKSNAPQFKGKTKEKRRQMAVAASYGAKNPSKK